MNSPHVVAILVAVACLGLRLENDRPKWLEDFEKKFPSAKKNATAGELDRYALEFGIDPDPAGGGDQHPSKEDLDAYRQVPFGPWLDSQLKTSDDSIALPPLRLREYLEAHQAALSKVVGLLQRDVPEWGFDIHEAPRLRPDLVTILALNRVLLAAALVEERAGRTMEAGTLLDASWSLYRSVAAQPDTSSQVIAIALGKMQAGVLRKMDEPPLAWTTRLASDEPRKSLLDALEVQPLLVQPDGRDPAVGSFADVWARSWRSVADQVRDMPACAMSKLSSEEIAQRMIQEFRKWDEPAERPEQVERDIKAFSENLTTLLRRASRWFLDRELTGKILELRQEKAASRQRQWPARYLSTQSEVCPEGSYEYRKRGGAMTIRFKGEIADPAAPVLVLPLSFDGKAPPTPTRTPKPRPAVTPSALQR